MKIHSLQYENKKLELKINPIYFSNLSLLVGVSGVGKTLILQSILDLREIARGKSLDGVEWEINFSTSPDKNYLWRGAFENTGIDQLGDILSRDADAYSNFIIGDSPKIIYEESYFNDKLVVERKENIIKLKGELTPKLSSYKSVLNLFNEEEIIAPVFDSFNRIIRSYDLDISNIPYYFENFDNLLKKHTTLESIQNSYQPTYIKLALAYNNKLDIFNTIKRYFIDIFTQVEDIKLTYAKLEKYIEKIELLVLSIKEKNVLKWIFQNKISSGMFKTLMQISELFLCAEGSVILIDEFENSLGINCIDTLTESLLYDDRNLQFILTSHHPYIINAIGMEHWKIVSRTGGIISAKDAKDFKLGNSRHEAFKQLIQLNEFRKGIRD
jgi:hypothetical protein